MPLTERPPIDSLPQKIYSQDDNKDKIFTGWQKFDELLSGGISRKEIIVFVSNTSALKFGAANE